MTREEAIDKLKRLCSPEQMTALKVLVPELQESEDEKIRKELLEEIEFIIPHADEADSEGLILPSYRTRTDRYKSYLEKQKEQKSTIEKLKEISTPADEDWFEIENKWETEDNEDLRSFISVKFASNAKVIDGKRFAVLTWERFKDISLELINRREEKQKEHIPSTEETELNSIAFLEQLGYTCIPPRTDRKPVITGDDVAWIDDLKHDLEHPEELDEKVQEALKKRQKPAEWSAEEKGILLECVSALQNSSHWLLADKLSSLRPQPKVVWNEGDEKVRKAVLDEIEHQIEIMPDADDMDSDDQDRYNELISMSVWMQDLPKCMKPHWKPSEEQMLALGGVLDYLEESDNEDADIIGELISDLKSL